MILIDNMHVHLRQAWAYSCLFLPFEDYLVDKSMPQLFGKPACNMNTFTLFCFIIGVLHHLELNPVRPINVIKQSQKQGN